MKLGYVFAPVLLSILFDHSACGQTAPLKYRTQACAVDTGLQSGEPGADTSRTVYSTTVRVPGAPWLRLLFSDANLGRASFLTVTSLYDGAQQRLDADAFAQWKNTSAYFNGEAVEI